jgi:hypothetical protein
MVTEHGVPLTIVGALQYNGRQCLLIEGRVAAHATDV